MEKYDYYRAELKKHPSGKSGADGAEDISNSTWLLFKCLSYLRNAMQTRTRSTNTISNFNSSEEADIESNSSHAYDVCQTQDNDNFTQDSSNIIDADLDNIDSDVSPAGGLKKKKLRCTAYTAVNNFRWELLSMEAKKFKLLENEEKEDEDLLFLKSLLPDLKKLSQTQKMRAKIKFQEILLQETLNLLQSTPTTNQTTVVSSFPYSGQWHITYCYYICNQLS